jgi:hypothetical protein
VGDDGLDGVGVGSGDNGLGGGLSSLLDGRDLVTDGGQGVGQESNEIGLNGGRDGGVASDGLDGL